MPTDLSESWEWGVQPLLRTQTLEVLPKKFGQLSISLSQHPPASQTIMVLAQPMFTFPSQGNVTSLSGVSPLFHSECQVNFPFLAGFRGVLLGFATAGVLV